MTDSARTGVLCAGSVLVDHSKIIDGYPEREHLASIEQVSSSTGGPALNMAVDLRMLGARWPVAVAGSLGDDENAAFVLHECSRLDIDVAGLRRVPDAVTSFTDAMVEAEGGRRTFFHYAGANALFDGADVAVESSRARVLHVGAPGIHTRMDSEQPGGSSGWCTLLRRARDCGMRTNMELVSIDPARVARSARPCLPLLDTIVINDFEASAVTGLPLPLPAAAARPAGWRRLQDMALDLVARGVSTLAVIHFDAGSVAAAPGGRTWRQGAVRVPRGQVRSTTGAGDAFAAGVLLGVHDGWPVERCLELGAACAAMCVRSPHTSAGIRPVAECLRDGRRDGHLDPGAADG